jgi:hypothetical protein
MRFHACPGQSPTPLPVEPGAPTAAPSSHTPKANRPNRTSRRGGRPLASVGLVTSTVAVVGAILITAAPAAGANTVIVHPGQSIQAAVDAARPGQTVRLAPGVFHQSVAIVKDGITLEGSGADATTIEPAAHPTGPCGSQQFGICVVGQLDQNNNVVRPVHHVRITELAVKNFSTVAADGQRAGVGVFVLGGEDTTVDHVVAAGNGSFGITSIASSGDRYLHDTASGSSQAGFQIAVPAGPGTTLEHNRAANNRFGMLVLVSSGGLVAHNQLTSNCSGLTLTNGASVGDAPTSRWVIRDNDASYNNRACPGAGNGPGAEPPVSGNGVAVWGARGIVISHNTVTGNRPSGPSDIPGGIVVKSTPTGDLPVDIIVTDNRVRRNAPADIIWDGTGSLNIFRANDCETSIPLRLCQ